jgi:hypothetical protein
MPAWAPVGSDKLNAMWFRDSGPECREEHPGKVQELIVEAGIKQL